MPWSEKEMTPSCVRIKKIGLLNKNSCIVTFMCSLNHALIVSMIEFSIPGPLHYNTSNYQLGTGGL